MTWSEFLQELMRLLDGDETTPTDLPIGTLQQIISMAERRIYREVQSRYNQKAFSASIIGGVTTPLVVTSNLAPVPDDLEQVSIMHFGGYSLLPVPEEWLRAFNYDAPTGDCIYFAQTGQQFTFGPAVSNATAVQGNYYYRLPALTNSTAASNLLFQNEHDLFLYACLATGAPVFKRFQEAPGWEANYQQIREAVNMRTMGAAYSAGRMRVNPSTRLMR